MRYFDSFLLGILMPVVLGAIGLMLGNRCKYEDCD